MTSDTKAAETAALPDGGSPCLPAFHSGLKNFHIRKVTTKISWIACDETSAVRGIRTN